MSLYTVYVSSILVLCVQTLVWHASVRHIHYQNAGHRALQQWCLEGCRHALRANCKGTWNTRPTVTSCSALHAGLASEGNHSSMSACRSRGMHGSLVSVCVGGGRGGVAGSCDDEFVRLLAYIPFRFAASAKWRQNDTDCTYR